MLVAAAVFEFQKFSNAHYACFSVGIFFCFVPALQGQLGMLKKFVAFLFNTILSAVQHNHYVILGNQYGTEFVSIVPINYCKTQVFFQINFIGTAH